MMFVRRPFTHSLFEPSISSPSISYLVLHPDHEDEETQLEPNKKKENDSTTKTEKKKKNELAKQPAAKSWPVFLDDFEVVEEDGHVVLSTDLPGIKHADLKVRFEDGALHVEGMRKHGSKKQSFIRRLAMDEDAIDIENLTAKLEDGVLTVKAPRAKKEEDKEEETRKVVVTKHAPPETPTELNLEIDMPGVRAENLEIVLAKNGMLSVFGERKSGKSQANKKTEAFMLNTHKVETGKLEAYLMDGVLTIRAPAKVHKVKTVAVNGKLPPAPKKTEKIEEGDEKEE